MTTSAPARPRTITALLITDYCIPCEATTDQELNTVALTIECHDCGHVEPVSETYARQMIAE